MTSSIFSGYDLMCSSSFTFHFTSLTLELKGKCDFTLQGPLNDK